MIAITKGPSFFSDCYKMLNIPWYCPFTMRFTKLNYHRFFLKTVSFFGQLLIDEEFQILANLEVRIQGRDSPKLKLYSLCLLLSTCNWRTLLEEKTGKVEFGESQPKSTGICKSKKVRKKKTIFSIKKNRVALSRGI